MAKTKALEELRAEELYALAQQREQEEAEARRDAMKQQIDALRAKRKTLVAAHRKEISAIDTKILKLAGKTRRVRSRTNGENLTDIVVDIVHSAGEISTQQIRAELDAQGIEARNLSQTLAYLKRVGKLASPGRSLFAPA